MQVTEVTCIVAVGVGARRHLSPREAGATTSRGFRLSAQADVDPNDRWASSASGHRSVPDRGHRQGPVGTGADGDWTLLVRSGQVADAVIADPPETQARAEPTTAHLGGLVSRDLLQ